MESENISNDVINMDNEGQKKLGKEWKDKRFRIDRGYSFWMCAKPIRSFGAVSIPSDISKYDLANLFICAMWLQADTNMLVQPHHGYDTPLTVEKIAEKIGISTRYCYLFIDRMIGKRIMARSQGAVYINPIYFFRGKYLSWHLYHLFQEDLDAFLPQWVINRFNGDINA